MLYVFLVDTGTMIQLDMNLALEKVSYLKGVIARSCRIPPDKQVLLISGGDSLEPEERVCKYAAGTDTNPIFLFSMVSIESPAPPEMPVDSDYGTSGGSGSGSSSESELNDKVTASLQLEDAQSTVAIRATLAQEYVKASSEQTRVCELLIHDQHLQHQGWSAVVANLEDLSGDLRKNAERLESSYRAYLDERDDLKELIDTFDEDIAVLHQIPVFPALLKASTTDSMVGSVIHHDSSSNDEQITLLEWINTRGSSQSLEQVADSCYRALQQMDSNLLEELKAKVSSAVDASQNSQMKEVRGLGDRLSGLEQLLIEAKRLVKEQSELAAAFVQNQQRAYGLKDASILPDLCASHRQQLMVMKRNHSQVVSISTRCAKAKHELSANLHHRMKWVVFIQNQMGEVGQLIVMHAEELKRLRRKLDVIEQIHLAPSMYMATAVEVVRRRAFAEHYLLRTCSLADKFRQVHGEEVQLRANFQAKLRKHFLSKMFPGMEDVPPSFATDRPDEFDNKLPAIHLSDVEVLRTKFPDLAKSLSVPEENALSNLLARSFNQTLTPEDGETLYSLQNMPQKIHIHTGDIGSMSVMNKLIAETRKPRVAASNLSDSETDQGGGLDRMRRSANGKKRKKSGDQVKLSQSLTSESSKSNMPRNQSTGFCVEADPSSSSADPSSSSAGNTTGNNSVAPSSSSGDGSNSRQWQETSTSCKLLTFEEKASLLAKLNETEAKLNRFQNGAKTSQNLETLADLKAQLSVLRDTVVKDGAAFREFAQRVKEEVFEKLKSVHEVSNRRLSLAVVDVEERVRKQSESDLDRVRDKLELEMQKLEDCHREIDIYRGQLEQANREIDKLKADLIDDRDTLKLGMAKIKEANECDKAEIVKKLTLEHEIELDALREELENSEKVAKCEDEVRRLREALQQKERDVEALRRKTRLLENSQEEKFHGEKDKIVQILEAGFAQREKLAVEKCEEGLLEKCKQDLLALEREMEMKREKALEELESKIKSQYEEQLASVKQELEQEMENVRRQQQQVTEAALSVEREKLQAEKEAALKLQHQQMTIQAKRDLDALRGRFKMMQTAGALERSPSASESELPVESPRQDMIDNIRSALVQEYDVNLRVEKSKWERQMMQMKEEHEQALVEIMSREKIRETAEHQVLFNEALKKAMDERDKQLDQVKQANRELEDKLDCLNLNDSQQADLVGQLAELSRRNTQLDDELQEARQKLEQAMASSVMALGSAGQDQDVMRLQKENAQLKEQLTKSMMALVSSGKVSVTSVDRGDIVMVVWNEDHHNFCVYTEANSGLPLHFLHTESMQTLGLSCPPADNAKRYTTGEVMDKEYCQAKKPENRFKVPQGTKFYRVRCKLANLPKDPMTVSNGSSSAKSTDS